MKSIPIRNKHKEIIAYTKVDDDIYDDIKDLSVSLTAGGYARIKLKPDQRLHRYILNAKKGDPFVDHIDRDKLNNQRDLSLLVKIVKIEQKH